MTCWPGITRCGPAAALLEQLPALDGKLVTADPLHCQRPLARAIVEKGGDHLTQIKASQPNLLAQAQQLDARKDPARTLTPIERPGKFSAEGPTIIAMSL